MKSLADRIAGIIPQTAHGLSLKAAIANTGNEAPAVRAAFDRLVSNGLARIVRRGRGGAVYIVLADCSVPICAVCQREFTRPPKSKRETCSNHCHAALRHRRATPEQKEKWRKTLSRVQSSPKALARLAAHNQRRWSDPKQHEMLSEQNRKRWKDPESAAIVAAKIRVHHQQPKMRAFYSELRKKDWARPEYAAMVKAKSAASLREQSRRAKISALVKKRWQDPELRAKYTSANSARNTPELRAANAERMRKRWTDPKFRAKMKKAAQMRDNAALHAKAEATRRARGWLKRNRKSKGVHL